jgi:ribonuclease Y
VTILPNIIAAFLSTLTGKGIKAARLQAQQIIEEAEEQKRKLILEGREAALKLRSGTEEEVKERRRDLRAQEKRHQRTEENLENRVHAIDQRESAIESKEAGVEETKTRLEELKQEQIEQLERIAGLSSSEARDVVLNRAEQEMSHDLAKRYYELERQMRERVDDEARKVITLAIQRLASDVVSERSTSRVSLPSDGMKGRLIGREGRNIRAMEAAMGVDILIDDTPEMITISCFDPIRREIARIALEKLIQDGRIHPSRIEDIVRKSQVEVEETIYKSGEEATFDANVMGLDPELKKLLGRLKYRYSYGENILQHSVEVSLLAGMIASEMGADVEVAKAGGLLHDIGKALTHEVEGPHAEIGAEVATKNKVPKAVVTAIAEHHDDDHSSPESFLVAAADAISAARPGARRDTVEHYLKRLQALEQVGMAFEGVEKCYAIQAGREIRILVKPEDIDDLAANNMARNVVKKIEQELTYPGQIKVTVIRENRSVEYAR